MTPSNLLDAIIIETAPLPTASIIWLHGLGAGSDDFVGIVPQLGLASAAAIRFIFPQAPSIPITINQGMVMPGWYDILDTFDANFERGEDEAGIRHSTRQINQLIQHEIDHGIAAQRILLVGFSQGGAIALHCGLRYPQRLAGIIALSAYLPLAATLALERHSANQDTPILMMHGKADPVVPIAMAEGSQQQLAKAGYDIRWRCYPMPHTVCSHQLTDIGQWINDLSFD